MRAWGSCGAERGGVARVWGNQPGGCTGLGFVGLSLRGVGSKGRD